MTPKFRTTPWWTRLALLASLAVVAIVYWPGLDGSWLFDDYPNIVDNHGVQIGHTSVADLARAALSSPSSEFKRPLSSLTFAINYLIGGLDPYGWKLFNLLLHLLNGLVVFALSRRLLEQVGPGGTKAGSAWAALLVAAGWMLLPINLTGVLYVVQRMESMANLFVLLGLLGYVAGRQRMLAGRGGLLLCIGSLLVPTAVGLTAKETAVMLPLYACIVEWIIFGFSNAGSQPLAAVPDAGADSPPAPRIASQGIDRRILGLFVLVLALPLVIGLAWLLPGLLRPGAWATRDFTMGTRLLSEARIVVDYIDWTLLPTPQALSFYHDDFHVSTGLLSPWTTLASLLVLAAVAGAVVYFRRRRPLVALGLALYLGCHLLTATILPLELIYEHRNYFASFGLLLAVVPWLAGLGANGQGQDADHAGSFVLARRVLLVGLLVLWTAETALTAYAWGNPLRLAQDLAARAPASPRAQYELGRTYIIYSHYAPQSPFTRLAYAPLERAMKLPESSILPEQALIFMNSRMHLPIKDTWWDSLIGKLKARNPGVQDESSLAALTQCIRDVKCDLPQQRMLQAFLAAMSHPSPSPRLLAMYGDYAWNVLNDHTLGLHMTENAARSARDEPAYRITLAKMLLAKGLPDQAQRTIDDLRHLNYGGRLTETIGSLQKQLDTYKTDSAKLKNL